MKTTTIIIADDHALFAEGLEQIINSMDEFKIITKVSNGRNLLQVLTNFLPEIVLLDINMPSIDGMQAALFIRKEYPTIKIVFVSMYQSPKLINLAKDIGAFGYIMKDTTAPELKSTLLAIKDGEKSFFSPNQTQNNNKSNYEQDSFLNKYKLSSRELEIIRLIKQGLPTKQIADTLNLSIYTVETHRKNINRKLNVQSPTELLAIIESYSII
ncbi:response regulator [Sphingobacterium lactis]|uniref:response regulator n=1 Tax=Sphingobacterium lactis TaxID=797291 RepID=UPI003F7D3A75